MYMMTISTVRKIKLLNTKQKELGDHKGSWLDILVNYPITET